MGLVHSLLGCTSDLLGIGANLVDALIYGFVDHDYGMAALSGVCAVTAGAGSIARMAAEGTRLQRGAMYVAKVSELVTNTAIAVRSGIGVATTGYEMYKKYVVNEKKMGWDTVGECAAFLLNAVALGTSTVNLASSAQTLGKMLKEDNVAGKLTDAVKRGINTVKSGAQTLLYDNYGSVPNVGNKGGSTTTRVGQWMSKAEYENFKQTGEIPRINVLRSGKEGYMKQAKIGDYYVEFDIDESILMEKNEELGWWLIMSKNNLQLKLAKRRNISLPEPIGTNIEHVYTKKGGE